MRDTNDDMIQLLDCSSEGGTYSALVRHKIGGKHYNLRFSIEPSDYPRLKRILQFRPFENSGVAPYKYFFSCSYSFAKGENSGLVAVRVEQAGNHKEYDFEISRRFMSNILWFKTLEDIDPVRGIIVP